jgi:hypothetical protein
MTRYFFHIRDDDHLLEDDEGVDLPTLGAARKEAVLSARELIAESLGSPEPWDHCSIEIWDDRQLIEVVNLSLVLSPRSETRH